jgi:predicted branched-subunit amino acid permease
MFMVLHSEQWKRLCSWYYIANSGNGYVHGTTLGTVETVMFMVLCCEQWKHMYSWNYIGNSGNEICSWYYIRNGGNGYIRGTTFGTVETAMFMVLHWEQWKRNVFMVLHWEQWKRVSSWYYIGNRGNGWFLNLGKILLYIGIYIAKYAK